MTQYMPDWVGAVRARRGPGKIGTARFIDTAARLRGIASVVEGNSVSLSRPVQSAESAPGYAPSSYALTASMRREGRLVVARDRFCVDNHGMVNTHIDGLNHFGLDETWHDGSSAKVGGEGPSIADWAQSGLVTRAILLDIPALRGTPWVAGDRPVGADDLDRAVAAAGVELERGDALLLYMGRDAYERAGHAYNVVHDQGELRPGIGKDGSHWLAEHDVSMLLWDFMEACGPDESQYSVHLLIWAVGLILIDNCDLSAARGALAKRRAKVGLLTVAPLNIAMATGCLVNPLLVV